MFHYWRLRGHATDFQLQLMNYMFGAGRGPSAAAAAPLRGRRGFQTALPGRYYGCCCHCNRNRILRCSFYQLQAALFHCPSDGLAEFGSRLILGSLTEGLPSREKNPKTRSTIGVTRAHGSLNTRRALITEKIPFTTVAS